MNKPLKNKIIMITRDRQQSNVLARKIKDLGGDVLIVPTIKISGPLNWSDCDHAIQSLPNYDWLIFTSANGVRYFLKRIQTKKSPSFVGKIAVIGEKTLSELEKYGWKTNLIPKLYSSTGLLEAFQELELSGKHILFPTSDIAGDELFTKLANQGALVNRLTVYRTLPRNDSNKKNVLEYINNNMLDAILFFSPSAVKYFLEIFGDQIVTDINKKSIAIAAIGATTAKAIEVGGLSIQVLPEKSTEGCLLEALVKYFVNRS
jgi:uroporphyrinogen-III synthase